MTCTITLPTGVLGSCTSPTITSNTGTAFTTAHIALAATGTAVGSVTFAVKDSGGATLGSTAGTGPLSLDLTGSAVPSASSFTLKGQVSAASFVGYTGTVTFTLS